MQITLFSFGYKHGLPEADTILDVRFLPNPFYVDTLKSGTGLEQKVAEYVLDNHVAKEFFPRFEPVLQEYIDLHAKAGRETVRFGIGCTGGRHRSVAVVQYLEKILNNGTHELTVFHRDIEKA